ncbi:hypothetical protein CS542_06075 [Pedobacter sp. IW39]|nr:hypothetical protein CS542_06075 [Pedobacter sp. IW39]
MRRRILRIISSLGFNPLLSVWGVGWERVSGRCHEAGIKIVPWTVNSLKDMGIWWGWVSMVSSLIIPIYSSDWNCLSSSFSGEGDFLRDQKQGVLFSDWPPPEEGRRSENSTPVLPLRITCCKPDRLACRKSAINENMDSSSVGLGGERERLVGEVDR